MQLSPLSIKSIVPMVTGDNESFPYHSGPDLVVIFNRIGFRDVYDFKNGGLPDKSSRKIYTEDRLKKINGTIKLKSFIEGILDDRQFSTLETPLDIKQSAKLINSIIQHDGYKAICIDGIWKINGENIPEEIKQDVHFESIESQIIEQIKAAKYTIWIAVAWLTNKKLLNELYKKKKEGLNIRIVIIDDDINNLRYDKYFETKRVLPKGKYQNIMHNKFCIIDNKVVIHGSYNWTNKANWNNETIEITSGGTVVTKFLDEFMQIIRD